MIAVNKHCKSYKVQRDLWVGQPGRRRKVKTVRHTSAVVIGAHIIGCGTVPTEPSTWGRVKAFYSN